MDKQTLRQLEQLLDYQFSDVSLVEESLMHSSQAPNRLASNERLEFFGDSVLALVICECLFTRFPTYLEGDLTKIKSMLVSRKTCSKLANKMGLAKFVNVGKGMATAKAMQGSISAGALEAVIAAVYLDGGLEAAKKVILRIFEPAIKDANANSHQDNFKSMLQQHAQQNLSSTPTYELLDEKGPDHNKCFECAVVIGTQRFESAWGVTKKDAEQAAAQKALVELKLLKQENTKN